MVGEVAKSFQEDSSFPLQNPRLRIRADLHLCSEKLHGPKENGDEEGNGE